MSGKRDLEGGDGGRREREREGGGLGKGKKA